MEDLGWRKAFNCCIFFISKWTELTAFSRWLFLQKSYIVDVRLGSEYVSELNGDGKFGC